MRFVTPLASLTAVSALVVSKNDISIIEGQARQVEFVLEELEKELSSSIDEAADYISTNVKKIQNTERQIAIDFDNILAEALRPENDAATLGYDLNRKELDLSNYTIYEIVSKSNHTTEFASYLKQHDDVVKILNDTKTNYTLYVPIDEAFKKPPPDEELSDKFVDNALHYHIGLGNQHTGLLFPTHTLPTTLNEKFLGGNPQRLRLSAGLHGILVNDYSKVVAANFKAKNGYIHAVNKILLPPFMLGRTISFFPAQFSTLLLAYEKTDFVKYVHGLELLGTTIFPPTNKAWERLGPKANEFLFNTEEGKKHLTALLKYQIVPNVTLYSDEVYYGNERAAIEDLMQTKGHFHIQLPTLLEKDVSVDIYKFSLWTSIVLNGAVSVKFLDGIGKNGVAQVVDYIPVPQGKPGDGLREEIEVEDLKRLLKDYVDVEDKDRQEPNEL